MGKGKRAAANHPEGDARGGKCLKAKDALTELEGSPEYRAKRTQAETMESDLGWALFQSQLLHFFIAMVVLSFSLLAVATVPAAVFSYRGRNKYRQEVEVSHHVVQNDTYLSDSNSIHPIPNPQPIFPTTQRLKEELEKLNHSEDSIFCKVKMQATVLTDPAAFFQHPLIMDRKLEAQFFGGRENFLSNFRVCPSPLYRDLSIHSPLPNQRSGLDRSDD
jgi:hypothetical protein